MLASNSSRGVILVVVSAARPAGVDGVAKEAQRGHEAPLGVVGLEHLDVGGEVDALGGQGGETPWWMMRRTHRDRSLPERWWRG